MDLEEGEETVHLDTPDPSPEASPVVGSEHDGFPSQGIDGHTNGHSNGHKRKWLLSHVVRDQGKGEPRAGWGDEERERPPAARPAAKARRTAPVPPVTPRAANPQTVGELARVLRSKASGPYEITFDILFTTQADFDLVRDSNILSRNVVAKALSVTDEDLIYCDFFEPALGFKATIPRYRKGKKVAAGGFMEDDVHGSQQYLPLINIKLPQTANGSD
jgi:hypothetical protein